MVALRACPDGISLNIKGSRKQEWRYGLSVMCLGWIYHKNELYWGGGEKEEGERVGEERSRTGEGELKVGERR